MPAESTFDLKFEIGHVLLIDIVGYSKLLINEQRERLETLNEIVRNTAQFGESEASGMLVRLPTGDGMALIFRDSLEAPVRCALELGEALKSRPAIQVRMGIHSGPVSEVRDVNERANIAGAGINIAQRVMDCGDAEHILLSKHVADDLEHYERWRPHLHDLGQVGVKHGVKIDIVNLYTDEAGNSQIPEKLRSEKRQSTFRRIKFLIAAAVLIMTALGSFLFFHRVRTQSEAIANEKSIAVLPFVDISQAKDQEYFCDGISEEILGALTKVEGLKVVARTSSFSFKGKNVDISEVTSKLNVENVLEGSLRRDGNRIRITAQLIAHDGFHLWSESYEREVRDIFAVQDEITRAIVNALKIKLAVPPQAYATPNTEAYEVYLKGRFSWNKRTPEAVKTSVEYFNQAIAKDPAYALAYTGLADSYSVLGTYLGVLSPREAMPKAKAAALKALEMNDTLSEAHTSLAFIKFNYDWDWPGAEREFRRAIELNPNNANAHHWYSHFLTAMGRVGESLEESRRALELDQLNPVMTTHLGWHYFYARQYDLAIDQHHRTIETDPNYGVAHWYLGESYQQKKMHVEAGAELARAKTLLRENSGVEADIGYVDALSAKRDQAQAVIDVLKERSKRAYVSSYDLALVYSSLGWKDQAFECLLEAHDQRSDSLVYLQVDPRFDSLRSDSRFLDVARRIGLPQR
jgi:adenylate cyclase